MLTDRPDVFPLRLAEGSGTDGGGKDVNLFLPVGYYLFVNEDPTAEEFRVEMRSLAQTVSVVTDAGRLLCCADDAAQTGAALIDGGEHRYEITLFSAEDGKATLAGTTGQSKPAFFARQAGQLSGAGMQPGEDCILAVGGTENDAGGLTLSAIAAVVTGTQSGVTSAVFPDVADDAACASALLWAYERGVVAAEAPAFLFPDEICRRGEALTLLWKALGKPVPETAVNPFADVKETDPFYEAVIWAANTGVALGVDGTHFAPDRTCTGIQFLTFLWRALGEPLKTGRDGWYADALAWAAETGLPGSTEACSRADAVIWLYQALR